VHARDAKRTIQLLKKMVPEYNPVPQLIEEGTPAQAIGSVKQSNEPLGYSIADF
jgi:hypothetical protein